MLKAPTLLVFLLSAFGFAQAQDPLVVAKQLFTDMASHNAAHARTLFLPEAMLFSSKPDGTADALASGKWLDLLASGKGKWDERIWDPKVLRHGSIAVVWAPYNFHLNGKFSHCGIDSFSLLLTNGEWKIASISDTREKAGCSPPDRE
ncbi:MAG TPA: hypothetical protein VHZ55_19855 [Bryobacteraceae bacterium]|jgi:hypothetical protein|nr:hypothetical protein [Bryobacteraceae bacterium]